MKRCPECRRDYYDDSLLFCLDDGSALLEGPVNAESKPLYAPAAWAAASHPLRTAESPNTEAAKPGSSIAVLPFVNMSADPENEYFCDGLAEELLNVLSKIKGLRVAARTSAFSFKGTQATIAEIGKTLNVASILEGSIRIVDKRIRISVQLVKVAGGYQLWSESYDRLMDDIFAVQDDIAQSVVTELRTRLVGEEFGAEANRRLMFEVAAAVIGRAANPEAQR